MDISGSIEHAVSAYFNRWFQEHQFIWWLLSHPAWSLVILLLSIVLFVGFLGAIGRGLEQFWLGLARTPLRISQRTINWLWPMVIKPKTNIPLSTSNPQINVLVSRLCQIQQEQDKLMQELLKIVKAEL